MKMMLRGFAPVILGKVSSAAKLVAMPRDKADPSQTLWAAARSTFRMSAL